VKESANSLEVIRYPLCPAFYGEVIDRQPTVDTEVPKPQVEFESTRTTGHLIFGVLVNFWRVIYGYIKL